MNAATIPTWVTELQRLAKAHRDAAERARKDERPMTAQVFVNAATAIDGEK